MSQCVWMLVHILGKKNSLITLARKIKVNSKMKKQYYYWKIFNFSLNLEAIYKMLCKWGILWTIYLLYRTLQNRPLFMISFNSNSSLFRISFNFVNTCDFFVICSFSPKKHHYKDSEMGPTSLQGPNIPSPMRSLLGGFTVYVLVHKNILMYNIYLHTIFNVDMQTILVVCLVFYEVHPTSTAYEKYTTCIK